ncbi:MAG: glycosyltransferase family 4 protein [Proteobacteria bacterium]|nr:glycosyltransferase family 4 protein [Pseudomonadota bacterium]
MSKRLLLGLTGVRIDGGIAGVNRCVLRALATAKAEGRVERVDAVSLLDEPSPGLADVFDSVAWARGSQARFVWLLWREARRLRPDLVFYDHLGLTQASVLPLPALRRSPHVVFIHGRELDVAHSSRRARGVTSSERILTNSRFTHDEVVELFPDAADRVRICELCIEPDRIDRWMHDAGEVLERRPAALIVGRMSAEERGKGHDALLEAWPQVTAQVSEAELWIAGGGDDRERIEQKARDIDAGGVRFVGRVGDEQLSRLYRTASVFAMPSRQEGFGLVYAEAMWHGLPCIASTRDAGAAVVEHGKTGLHVPYADPPALAAALASLLRDGERARAMGRAGRAAARDRFGYARFERDVLRALGIEPDDA